MTEGTKEKILDTAERLFGDQGYAGTSLRHIIAEAGVNLAAVHYHFGSKEDLLDELMLRRVTPVNEERLVLLERYVAKAGDAPVPVKRIFEALLMPILTVSGDKPHFGKLMGRMHAEGLMPMIIRRHFRPIVERFSRELRRSLPELPEEELFWRMHFMTGSMAHAIAGTPTLPPPGGDGRPLRRRLELLVTFLSAAFLAAPTAPEENGNEK